MPISPLIVLTSENVAERSVCKFYIKIYFPADFFFYAKNFSFGKKIKLNHENQEVMKFIEFYGNRPKMMCK